MYSKKGVNLSSPSIESQIKLKRISFRVLLFPIDGFYKKNFFFQCPEIKQKINIK